MGGRYPDCYTRADDLRDVLDQLIEMHKDVEIMVSLNITSNANTWPIFFRTKSGRRVRVGYLDVSGPSRFRGAEACLWHPKVFPEPKYPRHSLIIKSRLGNTYRIDDPKDIEDHGAIWEKNFARGFNEKENDGL